MRRKSTILALVLAFTLILGLVPAFAAFPDAGIETSQKIKSEVDAETIAMNLYKETQEGKYKLIDTEGVKGLVGNKSVLIVDTMPDDWYAGRHVPGAVNAFAPLAEGKVKDGPYTDAQKKKLLDQVKKFSGTKTVKTKYYWHSKKKKWVTKKPAKKYYKKCTKKKDKHKGKKSWTKTSTVDVKDKKIVVYCGFVVCTRSHVAAKYLASQGYTNVYRYPGGISAWVDAGQPVEGTDNDKVDPVDYVKMGEENPDAWKALGIEAGEIKNSDFVIDVRPDAKRESDGFVAGAEICPVSNPYTEDQQAALLETIKKQGGGGRIVFVCVTGNKLAQNAMTALSAAGVDMSNVTYLKGGFETWKANYPVVSPDQKSVSVAAWVTKGAGPNGELMMVKGSDGNVAEKCADMTHHVLVNKNGSNAPVALLNTNALPLQVYKGLQTIGGEPYDKFNSKDQTDEYSLAGKGSAVNVTVDAGDGPKTLDYFFDHVTKTNAEILADDTITKDNVPTEPYTLDMRFSGGMKNIQDKFDSVSGNQTGCITCTFSCWIGTVSNGAYEYNTQEAKVNREHTPAAETPVTVVYTIGA